MDVSSTCTMGALPTSSQGAPNTLWFRKAKRSPSTIGAEDDSDLMSKRIIEAVNRVTEGWRRHPPRDMFGGTPSNLRRSPALAARKWKCSPDSIFPCCENSRKVREDGSLPDAICDGPRQPAANTPPSQAGFSPSN